MPATHTGNRRWGIGVVALTAGLTLAGCGAAEVAGGGNGTGSSSTPSPSASPTPSGGVTIAELTTGAQQAAIQAHDPDVHVALAVLTTRQAAVTLTSGALINSDEAVYLVQLVGNFTLTNVSIPPGGSAPTGTDLDIDVDVSNGDAVDTGLSRKASDLSKLGPVIVLRW